MKNIVRLEIQGVKSVDSVVELAPRTLVLGDVGSGKSRVADAVRFLSLGYIPALGKSEAATARVMRGASMRVRAHFDDGTWAERTLSRKGAKIQGGASCSWLPEDANATEAGEAIRALFGATDQEAAECLDLRELLAATPQQRASRIEAILDATGMDVETQTKWSGILATARLADMDEARVPADIARAEVVSNGLAATLSDAQREALYDAHAGAADTLRDKGLADAILWAGARRREAADAVRGKTQARKEVEDRVQGLKAPATTLDELASRRQALSDQAAGLASRLDTYRRSLSVRKEAGEAESVAQAAIDSILCAHDPVQEAERLRQAAADLRAQAEAIKDPEPIAAPEAAEERDDLADALRDLERQAEALDAEARALNAEPRPVPPTPEPVPSVEPWRIGVTRAMADAEKVAKSPWAQVVAVAAVLGGVLENETLSETASERITDSEETLRRLAEEHGEDPRVAEERVLAARNRLAAEEKRVADITERNATAQALYQEHVAAWDECQAKAAPTVEKAKRIRADVAKRRQDEQARVREENTRRRRAHADATAERSAIVARNDSKRKALRAEADKSERAASDLLARWEKAKAAREAARAKLDGLDAVAPLDEADTEAEIAGLTAQVGEIDEQRRVLEGADARRRELALLAAELVKAQAERDAYAAVEWACQRIRERDLAARNGPIVERMSRFMRAAGRPEEPFVRASKGRLDFGWSRDGVEIAGEALSGGESCLFSAALAIAIITLRSPPVTALLIEAAELGLKHTGELLAGIDAFADRIGTAITCTCLPVQAPAGWVALRMDATEPAEVAS